MKPPEPFAALNEEAGSLPIATQQQVLQGGRQLLGRHRKGFIALTALNGVAAAASVVGPQVLGSIVEGVGNGETVQFVDKAAAIFLVALLVQSFFTRWARMRASILGEGILADLREAFVSRVVQLPPGIVERAGTGDLVTRTTTDVD
jgi:ABC-type multidrug transport system fused ATPase/permease subunit